MPRRHWSREVGTLLSFPAHAYEGEENQIHKEQQTAYRFTAGLGNVKQGMQSITCQVNCRRDTEDAGIRG